MSIIDNLKSVQRELNKRMSKTIYIIKEMTEFKEHFTTRDSFMGILERATMIIRARSIFVKRKGVIEDLNFRLSKQSNPKECLRRALNAKRIVRYKQSEKWFGTWIVWYVE